MAGSKKIKQQSENCGGGVAACAATGMCVGGNEMQRHRQTVAAAAASDSLSARSVAVAAAVPSRCRSDPMDDGFDTIAVSERNAEWLAMRRGVKRCD